jgi:hypothetical protein
LERSALNARRHGTFRGARAREAINQNKASQGGIELDIFYDLASDFQESGFVFDFWFGDCCGLWHTGQVSRAELFYFDCLPALTGWAK